MMSDSQKCTHCGARFDVPGAVGTLAQHMASFHPDKATKAQQAAAEKTEELTTLVETTPAALADMTNKELKAIADGMSLDVGKRPTNQQLVVAIEEARAAGG
jgi:hypothetical protein